MQYPEKIVGIKPGDRVLDIGPGGNPHPKANVYLELRMSEEEAAAQRGYAEQPELKGEVVYYDGEKFPFEDMEFDYVICSHVIEHVPHPKAFMAEIFRVGKRGYLEYPTIYYEYLYNFDVHRNFIKRDFKNNTLLYLKKSNTSLSEFIPVQDFFKLSLEGGHYSLIEGLKEYMFEGFEWSSPFIVKKSMSIAELAQTTSPPKARIEPISRLRDRIRGKLKTIIKG